MDRLNLKRRNAFYGDWWDEAAQWRTGGFDRLGLRHDACHGTCINGATCWEG